MTCPLLAFILRNQPILSSHLSLVQGEIPPGEEDFQRQNIIPAYLDQNTPPLTKFNVLLSHSIPNV